jgi:hypothetical protein
MILKIIKPLLLLWCLIYFVLSCTKNSSATDNKLVKNLGSEQDSLLNEAKWELYKLNIDTTTIFKWKKYVFCNNTLIPFINHDFNLSRTSIQVDTIRFFFSMQKPDCTVLRANGVQMEALFLRGDSSNWNPFNGIVYVSRKKSGVCLNGLVVEPLYKDDGLFAQYIEANQDSITNRWLLSYYNNVIKKRLSKKE